MQMTSSDGASAAAASGACTGGAQVLHSRNAERRILRIQELLGVAGYSPVSHYGLLTTADVNTWRGVKSSRMAACRGVKRLKII